MTVRDAEGRERPVLVADIRVRVNNWDRIRADHLRDGVAAALGLGAAATLLIVGIVSRASAGTPKGGADRSGPLRIFRASADAELSLRGRVFVMNAA